MHEGHADGTSLPIILLVELKELTGSVWRENAVVHVQSRLEGDESGVMLQERVRSTASYTRRETEGRKERRRGEVRQTLARRGGGGRGG